MNLLRIGSWSLRRKLVVACVLVQLGAMALVLFAGSHLMQRMLEEQAAVQERAGMASSGRALAATLPVPEPGPSAGSLQAARDEFRIVGVLIVAAALAVSVALLAAIAYALTRNLAVVAEASREVAAGRYDIARGYLGQAMGIVRELGDTSSQVYNYNYLATSYWEQGLRDSALAITEMTIALSHAARSLELESAAEEKMYQYLKELGRGEDALVHLERHVALKDSLDAVKESELINRLEIGYETDKKERTIQLQQLRMEQDQARIRAREVQRNILIGTLAALLIVGFLIYRNVSHKRTLAEQQKRISEQRVEQVLTEQELHLVNATMEGQDKERQRVARDLHDRVGSLLSGVKMRFSLLEDQLSKVVANGPEQFKKTTDLLDTAVGEVRRISHDLLSGNLAAFGLKAALTDLGDAVHVPGTMEVELSLFGLEQRMDAKVEVAAYRIVQEAVSNALKHAQATALSIQVTRMADHLNIIVEDNGRGFDPAKTVQGMGTANLHARAAELGGNVNIDPRPGRGTSVSVDIPLA